MQVMGAMARGFCDAVRRALYKRLDTLDDVRLDAHPDALIDALDDQTRGRFSTQQILSAATTVEKRVEKHSTMELKRVGVKLTDDPKLKRLVKDWRSHLVDRVQFLEADQLGKLKKILKETAGRRVESIKNDIEWQLDVTESQAALLARNQVVQLYQGVNETRMQAAGIEEYIWTTAGNEKVSDAHAELEGERFRFDDPPTDSDGNTGNPGLIRPNCQCQAYPVIAALEESDSAAA